MLHPWLVMYVVFLAGIAVVLHFLFRAVRVVKLKSGEPILWQLLLLGCSMVLFAEYFLFTDASTGFEVSIPLSPDGKSSFEYAALLPPFEYVTAFHVAFNPNGSRQDRKALRIKCELEIEGKVVKEELLVQPGLEKHEGTIMWGPIFVVYQRNQPMKIRCQVTDPQNSLTECVLTLESANELRQKPRGYRISR